ncbi:formin-like protein 2 [Myzus persicae]|uniref:formin-like protein 2 n=1 Tax=Myzus persicae TaxID=13164 RepID=UPI000B931467|nr:formin-like protein 2 [Myzus persicae]
MTYEFNFSIIGVVRVSVVGMFAFLHTRHLIELFYDARKNMPKKLVKCFNNNNIGSNDASIRCRSLVSVSDKSINACVQVNLDPAAVSGSIDIEQFQKMIEINLQLENRLTELEEMIRRGDENQKIQDLQDFNNKVDTKLSNYQQSLKEKIDDELMTIDHDVESIKCYYGMLNTSFHEMENKLISLESNSEKPMHKYNDIKTRIATLEREVMKNTSHIIGMNYSHRSLEWTRPQSFGSAGMLPPDNRCYGEPAAFAAAPSYYDMPPMAKPGQSGAVLPPSPTAPPTASAFVPPPPPALPSTSVFCQPLPPATPALLSQNTPKKSDSDKSSSSSTAKVEKVYGRIPITTEILQSVLLKPPGERKRVSKPSTAKVEKVSGRIPITAEILKSVVLKPPGERMRVSKSVKII